MIFTLHCALLCQFKQRNNFFKKIKLRSHKKQWNIITGDECFIMGTHGTKCLSIQRVRNGWDFIKIITKYFNKCKNYWKKQGSGEVRIKVRTKEEVSKRTKSIREQDDFKQLEIILCGKHVSRDETKVIRKGIGILKNQTLS